MVVIGDFNTEPFEITNEYLHAGRSRALAQKTHYSEVSQKKLRLYNCSWRMLGETNDLSSRRNISAAGTHFWETENSWHTFDHVIVSGTLLSNMPPYLDEEMTRIYHSPRLLGVNFRPSSFNWNAGDPKGVSDHLPIVGRILF